MLEAYKDAMGHAIHKMKSLGGHFLLGTELSAGFVELIMSCTQPHVPRGIITAGTRQFPVYVADSVGGPGLFVSNAPEQIGPGSSAPGDWEFGDYKNPYKVSLPTVSETSWTMRFFIWHVNRFDGPLTFAILASKLHDYQLAGAYNQWHLLRPLDSWNLLGESTARRNFGSEHDKQFYYWIDRGSYLGG